MTKYANKKFKNIISDYGDFKRTDSLHAGFIRLGRSVRRVIPACVISAIHKEFPDPNGNYTGYRQAR